MLRKYNIEIWADLGSLLGFTREGKLLDWEEDIDVGTLATREDFRKAEDYLEQYGWKMFDKYKGLAIQNKKLTTKIDIKFYKETEDFVYAFFVVYKHKWILPICDLLIWGFKKYPANYKYETKLPRPVLSFACFVLRLFPFKQHLIKLTERVYYKYGLTGHKISFPREWILPLYVQVVDKFPFRIPKQPERILKLTYGKNWKKPLKIISGTDRYEDGSSRYLTIRVKEQRPDLVEAET